MSVAPIPNAPDVFSAPLISAERPAHIDRIFAAIGKALTWIRSLFACVFPIKEKKVTPLPTRDIQLAQQALQAARGARPNPLQSIRQISKTQVAIAAALFTFSWYRGDYSMLSVFLASQAVDVTRSTIVAIALFTLSRYQGSYTMLSNFVAKKAVDVTSAPLVTIANAFFPAYSDAFKKGVALIICAPAVWLAADHLGYPQGWSFAIIVGTKALGLAQTIYSYHQTRKQREAQRIALANPTT